MPDLRRRAPAHRARGDAGGAVIVALILVALPVIGFVLLLIFSDLGGNEPTVPTSSNKRPE